MYRTTTTRFAFLMLLCIAVSCSGKNRKAPVQTFVGEPSLIEVSIGGMTCTGCEETIKGNVGKVEGVRSVRASFKTGKALVEYYPQMTDTLKIRDAVTGSGYTVRNFSQPEPGEALE